MSMIVPDAVEYWTRETGETPPDSVRLVTHRLPTSDEVRRGLELEALAQECLSRTEGPVKYTYEVREGLADYAHEAWSRWMEYLFSKCTVEESGVTIPSEFVTRWQRQMATPYAQLTDGEKQSDREEADKMLRIING